MEIVFFSFFAAIVVFSAIAVAFQRNLLYASFLLLFTLLGVAFLFLMAKADFLAVTQILIYVGGVLTLFLFGILITKRRENRFLTSGIKNQKVAAVIAIALAIILFSVIEKEKAQLLIGNASAAKTQLLGVGLLGEYLLPFELVGVLLLVVLIGVLSIATSPVVYHDKDSKED